MRHLVELMESRGVTVEQVAESCGHRPETVARWLRDEGRGFSVWDILSIHEALFCDMARAEYLHAIAPGNRLN